MRVHYFRAISTEVQVQSSQVRWSHVRRPKVSVCELLIHCVGLILMQVACLASIAQQVSSGNAPQPVHSVPDHASLAVNYGKLPLNFEENQGQADPRVRFLSRGNGYSLFLTDKEAVLTLRSPASQGRTHGGKVAATPSPRSDIVRMQLAGVSSAIRVSGEDKLPGTANYFIGNDPNQWHSSVPTFGKVKYKGVYQGVDLIYYGNQRELEYDFVVAPGADPKQIRLNFAGAEKLSIDGHGNLSLVTAHGKLAFHRPTIYQGAGSARHLVDGRFSLLSRRAIAFNVGSYDRTQSLIIDPTLTYSTYLGGSGSGGGFGDVSGPILIDDSNNIYVAGSTWSADFPTTAGSYDPTDPGLTDGFQTSICFVTKINAAGNALLYSTYIGGNGSSTYAGNFYSAGGGDGVSAMAVDANGDIYLTGGTWSSDFPISSNAFQKANKAFPYGFNAFVAKLNPAGSSLLYSTYLGGSANVVTPSNVYGDGGRAIARNLN